MGLARLRIKAQESKLKNPVYMITYQNHLSVKSLSISKKEDINTINLSSMKKISPLIIEKPTLSQLIDL